MRDRQSSLDKDAMKIIGPIKWYHWKWNIINLENINKNTYKRINTTGK